MIKSAAIRHALTGDVVIASRHDLCFAKFWETFPELKIVETKRLLVQGFVTHDDRFVSREEAAIIAFECKQIPIMKRELFSEDYIHG